MRLVLRRRREEQVGQQVPVGRGAGLLMGRGLIGDFKGFGCFPAGERILEQRSDVMATGSLWPWLSDQTKGGAHLGSTLQ